MKSLPCLLSGKEPACQCRRCRFNPVTGRFPGELTAVFLPGKPHGQRSLAGYSRWGHKSVRHNLVTKQQ